jgi:dTDP-4-dehydrorhamnose reductase
VCYKYKPEAIVHLAAETDVDRCERDPEYAYLVNSIGTYNIAIAAKELGAKLIYISTAGIFDGLKEGPYIKEDEPNPKNFYGHSKFLGELAVKGILKNYLILRVCWMMGGGPNKDQKFVAKIINQIKNPQTKEIKVITDQIGSPTFAKDLIKAIKILIQENRTGIFHMANTGIVSRYEVAKFIVETLRPEVKVIPVDSSYFNLDAKRTRNEGLVSKVNLMRPWQEALKEYLETEWKPIFKK